MTPKNYIEQGRAVIIADDFAMSQGTDSAIAKLLHEKKITATSVLVTSNRFDSNPAVELPENSVGLHLDFTFGKAVSIVGKSLMTDEIGNFNKSFVQIMLLCVYKKNEIKDLLSKEIDAQILKLKAKYGNIMHIDGHQHIHMNPLIFHEVKHLAEKHNIPRVRFINEKLFHLRMIFPSNWANTIKLLLLRTLGIFCRFKTDIYFVSILHTCKISKHILDSYQVPKQYQKVEIMLHPSEPSLDLHTQNKEKVHLLSKFRLIEKNSLES